MVWAIPEHDWKSAVAAGRKLAHKEFPVTTKGGLEALAILNNRGYDT